LELVLLDIDPEFLGDLGAWDRLGADDLGKRRARGDRLHERGGRLPGLLLDGLFSHAAPLGSGRLKASSLGGRPPGERRTGLIVNDSARMWNTEDVRFPSRLMLLMLLAAAAGCHSSPSAPVVVDLTGQWTATLTRAACV